MLCFFIFFSYTEKTAFMLPVFYVFLSSQSKFYCHGRKKKNTRNAQCDEFQQCLKIYRNSLIQLQGSFANRNSFHLKKNLYKKSILNTVNYGTERLYSQCIFILFCSC